MLMPFLSVCSGIEAASCAWEPFGWRAQAFAEIDPFARALLKHRFSDVPNLGDMTRYASWPDLSIRLLCGGTPCQSYSLAGLRKGLADPNGDLMLTFVAIAARYRPDWLVWENVPGVLSSNKGRDFGTFLGLLGHIGYGFAYRILDAQFFGVAQRRRRVFVVGRFGDWRRAAAVLFERQSLSGHPAPSQEACKRPAFTLAGGARKRGGFSYDDIPATVVGNTPSSQRSGQKDVKPGHMLAFGGNRTSGPIDVAPTLLAQPGSGYKNDFESETFLLGPTHTLRGEGFDASEDGTGRGTPLVPVVDQAMRVRRLTPRECERLQGFPDDWTAVPYRRKSAQDGPRYKALGNSWAVPCARWIGRRIEAVEEAATC